METGQSSTIAPLADRTPRDVGLRDAAAAARSLGLEVTIKPHVDVLDGTFRGEIAPASPFEWFASYRRMLTHYAALAEEVGASVLVIGTEFASLSADEARVQGADSGGAEALLRQPHLCRQLGRRGGAGPLLGRARLRRHRCLHAARHHQPPNRASRRSSAPGSPTWGGSRRCTSAPACRCCSPSSAIRAGSGPRCDPTEALRARRARWRSSGPTRRRSGSSPGWTGSRGIYWWDWPVAGAAPRSRRRAPTALGASGPRLRLGDGTGGSCGGAGTPRLDA